MIDTSTRILGLIGYPLGHSLSPRLHNYYLQELDLNYVYLPFELEPGTLEKAIEGLKVLKFRGLNVTIPYKEEIIPLLDELDEMAERIGAVNTIVHDEDKLIGYNTDAAGFLRMLKEDGKFKANGKSALIIGAGGASRAVGAALCDQGIKNVFLTNRTEKRAGELVEKWKKFYPRVNFDFGELTLEYYGEIIEKVELVVDTTPVGMEPETDVPPVIKPEVLHEDLLVVDLVYNPLETTLIKSAKSRGARTLNGMSMLLYQGIESFKLWTGVEPDRAEIGTGFFKGGAGKE